MSERLEVDVAVIGASLGGVIAAWRACETGVRVALTAEHAWIGGQMTAQAVPPDEHSLIEFGGATNSYREFRAAIRRIFLEDSDFINASAMTPGVCNPGDGWVSRLSFPPRLAMEYFEALLAPHVASGRLIMLRDTRPNAVIRDDRRIQAVLCRQMGRSVSIHANYFLDATDTGELLALSKHSYRIGKESRDDFNEPDAPTAGDRSDQQPITAVLALRRSQHPAIDLAKPASYDHWRTFVVANYGHRLFSEFGPGSKAGDRMRLPFFAGDASTLDWWRYRRVVAQNQWRKPVDEVSLVNWAQNDYAALPYLDDQQSASEVEAKSRELSLAFLYWLRHEAPRENGRFGYPELLPAGEITGTADGLAQQVYVRESRRMVTRTALAQNDIVSIEGDLAPFHHPQSVGVGWYNMDIHPTVVSGVGVNARVRPFTVPLGCFVSDEIDNLIPACKNIGVTHLVNAATRVHPIEWLIGEVAALLAARCIETKQTPLTLLGNTASVSAFQDRLSQAGIPLRWDADLLSHIPKSSHGQSHA